MKKTVHFLILLLFAFTVSNSATAQESKANSEVVAADVDQRDNNAIALTEAMLKFDDALIKKNIDELNIILSPDLEMIHSNGMKESKETLVNNIMSGILEYKEIIQLDGCKNVIVGGKSATTHRNLDVTGLLDGNEFSVKLTTKEEWILEKDRWKLVRRESKNRE